MTNSILAVVAQIVGLIVIGALLKWAQILRTEHAALLNSIVINLTLPATVFGAVLSLRKVKLSWLELLRVPLISYVVIIVCGLAAYVVTRLLRMERRTAGALIIVAMLGSTAFLGYPLKDALFRPPELSPECTSCFDENPVCRAFAEDHAEACAAYDEANASAVFYSELGTLIPILTVAVVIASRYGEGERFTWRNLLAVLKFGPFVAFLLGLLFYTENIPPFITSILGLLARATVPLIMLSLGITIRWGNFFGRHARAILAVNLIKLVLAPLLAFVLCLVLGLSGEVRTVTTLMASLPSLMICLAYANQYHLDVEFASNALFASFFFGAITLPLIASLIPR